ncbi:rhamnogalacturonan acetylesterase [Rufibacter latericius]|uniref:Rhamnogalacturonan acetylesterase n=1 Tax=Rufibacter latericius TaxID=2487040 RepID=A0A3M9M8T6_9BACT|nr:rhamnogalacturonan acetylesterase [Rufibacter latericius]RNI21971.1 rhamnogalacturonan acetylesterase [Rufibacter latericius]
MEKRLLTHKISTVTKTVFRGVLLLGLLVLASFSINKPQNKVKVYLIGDSTVAHYEPQRYPMQGWGMPFSYFFDSTVTVQNKARGGRSTRTFLSEGLWKPITDSLKEGDYVFMQFGHNDEAKEPQYAARYTPVPDYRKNLIKFISETRAKKAIPVLITPVTRMVFDASGKAQETHTEYSQAVRELARELKVPMIDLDRKSLELVQRMGPEHAKDLFNQLEPGEHPNYPEGIKDNTHFSEFGARKMAQLVLAEIRALKLPLADRIVKQTPK